MTPSRTSPTVRRLISQGQALSRTERAEVVRALLGEDGLMGAIEAAAVVGVAQSNLRPVPGLPTALQTLRCGSVWLSDEIEPFAGERKAAKAA